MQDNLPVYNYAKLSLLHLIFLNAFTPSDSGDGYKSGVRKNDV